MKDWGYWAPSAGEPGVADVTLSGYVEVNYRHPRGVTVDAAAEAKRISAVGSGHSGGINAALADGSVKFLTNQTSLTILRALATRAGAESTE